MRLLLVEDAPGLQQTVALGLRKAGYAVDTASDGEEALWRVAGGIYDLIVLDVMLPKVNGLEVLRRLRRDGNKAHVLLLTARNSVEDRVEGLRAGADDYLTKPFAFEELLARAEALVRRRYENKDPVLRIGDLEVDTANRSVRRAGQAVSLTPREYRLLEFLAHRRGVVVARSEIEEHIYSDDKELFSNAVESTISVLRKKLDAWGGGTIIHTRRGMGYVLDVSTP